MEITLQCERCGEDLDFTASLRYKSNDVYLEVKPCAHCLEWAKNEGIEEGMEAVSITQDDLNDAVKKAFDSGYEKGYKEGLESREEIL